MDRIKRRFVDRIVSLFTPLRRYRCRNVACEWEGNLRHERKRVSLGSHPT
jgi:hypothetical protein